MERIGGEKSVILHTMSRVSGRCLANCRRTRDVSRLASAAAAGRTYNWLGKHQLMHRTLHAVFQSPVWATSTMR